MLITSTTSTAGTMMKNISAPQPSDAQRLAPELPLHGAQLPRHERRGDQRQHQAERRLDDPAEEAEPPIGRMTPLATHQGGAPVEPRRRSAIWPVTWAPGSRVRSPPKQDERRRPTRRQVARRGDGVGPDASRRRRKRRRGPDGAVDVTSPPKATTASVTRPSTVTSPPNATTDGTVLPAGHDDVLAEADLRAALSTIAPASASRRPTHSGSSCLDLGVFDGSGVGVFSRRLRRAGDGQAEEHQHGGQRRERQRRPQDPHYSVVSHHVTSMSRRVSSSSRRCRSGVPSAASGRRGVGRPASAAAAVRRGTAGSGGDRWRHSRRRPACAAGGCGGAAAAEAAARRRRGDVAARRQPAPAQHPAPARGTSPRPTARRPSPSHSARAATRRTRGSRRHREDRRTRAAAPSVPLTSGTSKYREERHGKERRRPWTRPSPADVNDTMPKGSLASR